VRECRLAVEVKTSCATIEEATDPPDYPEGETLVLEGMEEASVVCLQCYAVYDYAY
jgi:hypothetical protein